MPFLEKDEIARIYHEAAEERKKTAYFKVTYLEQKKELDQYRKYKSKFQICLLFLIVVLVLAIGYFVVTDFLEIV